MNEEEAFKLLASALASLPAVAGFLSEAIAAGHGDPVTRRKVADVLPVVSESRKAQLAMSEPPAGTPLSPAEAAHAADLAAVPQEPAEAPTVIAPAEPLP